MASMNVYQLLWMRLFLFLLCACCLSFACGGNECTGDVSNLSIDPNGSMCDSKCECNNQAFSGICKANRCVSSPRATCLQKGTRHPCIPIEGCSTGHQICQPDYLNTLRLGDCIPDKNCKNPFCQPGQKRPCFQGKPITKDVGSCKSGTQFCEQDKRWGKCIGEVAPTVESCNNKDDDCDGKTDEDLTRACYTGAKETIGKGICKQGEQSCFKGKWGACQKETRAKAEECNKVDDDCDGKVDEALTQDCYTGPAATKGKGACKSGKRACKDGKWEVCTGEKKPSKEVCNGKDDDCDGQTDESVQDAGKSCQNPNAHGICKPGKQSCQSGKFVCVSNLKGTPEMCDGVDNNCDGKVDETCQVCIPDQKKEFWNEGDIPIHAMVFHPNKPYILTAGGIGSYSGPIRFWQTSDGKYAGGSSIGQDTAITSLAVNVSGKWLASGAESGQIKLWALDRFPKRMFTATIPKDTSGKTGHKEQVNALALSSNGRFLISGGESLDGSIKIWDLQTPSKPKLLRSFLPSLTRNISVHSIAISSDDKFFIVGTSDGKVYLYTGLSNPTRSTLATLTKSVQSVAISQNRRWVVAGSHDNSVRVWDLQTKREVIKWTSTKRITGIAISSDSTKVIASSEDQKARMWDITTKKLLQTTTAHNGLFVYSIVYRNDGKMFATAGGNKPDTTLKLWDVTGSSFKAAKSPLISQAQTLGDLAFSPDGSLLALGYASGKISLLDSKTRKTKGKLKKQHTKSVRSFAFHPQGKQLLSVGDDGALVLWDLGTLKSTWQLTNAHSKPITSSAFHPNGYWIATGSADRTAKIWDLRTKQSVDTMTHQGTINTIAFSPDGKYFALGGGGKNIDLWDITKTPFKKVHSFLTSEEVVHFAFHPQKNHLVAGMFSLDVEIWDVQSGKKLKTLSGNSNNLFVSRVAFTKNSNTLAISFIDGEVLFWDSKTYQKQSKKLFIHQSSSSCALFGVTWHPKQSLIATHDFCGFVHFSQCP